MKFAGPYINRKDGGKFSSENIHHIVPRHRGGSDMPENKEKLYTEIHNALHRLFGTLPPLEQIDHLMKLNNNALTLEFKQDIANVLSEKDRDYFYVNGVRRR